MLQREFDISNLHHSSPSNSRNRFFCQIEIIKLNELDNHFASISRYSNNNNSNNNTNMWEVASIPVVVQYETANMLE